MTLTLAIGGLALAVAVALSLSDFLTWLTGRISPDRVAWCRFVASGGSFKETR